MTKEEREKHLFISTIEEPGFPERSVGYARRGSGALAQALAATIVSPDAVVRIYGVRLPWHIRTFPFFDEKIYALHMLRQGCAKLILESA